MAAVVAAVVLSDEDLAVSQPLVLVSAAGSVLWHLSVVSVATLQPQASCWRKCCRAY